MTDAEILMLACAACALFGAGLLFLLAREVERYDLDGERPIDLTHRAGKR